MMEAEPKRIDPGDQPTPRKATETRRRIALLVLLATIGVGVYLFAPKIPHDVEVRLNFVHMERGLRGDLTVDKLSAVRVEVERDGTVLERISLAVPTRQNPIARFQVKLAPGTYRFRIVMRFSTPKGLVFDRFDERVTLAKQRRLTITP